ncbi:hypothetical protein D3C86_1598540 [compost metagenome]
MPASTSTCCALPALLTKTVFPLSTGIMASFGIRSASFSVFKASFIFANEPGSSSFPSLGTRALICKVRVCVLMPGSMAKTLPVNFLAEPSVLNDISEPVLI